MKWRSLLKSLARMAVLFVIMSLITILSQQSKLIYFPRRYPIPDIAAFQKKGVQLWEYRTSQGQQTAFYLPARSLAEGKPPDFLWLIFGGNASVSLHYYFLTDLLPENHAFLFVDYPGYGLCEGSPNPTRILESFRALRHEIDRRIPWGNLSWPRRTGIFGHSLGAATGLMAVEELNLAGALLCAPFTSMMDMARIRIGSPMHLLTRHRFDNRARLAALRSRSTPVRIFHGVEDSAIPVAMSRELLSLYPRAKLTEVTGAEHGDILDLAGQDMAAAMVEMAKEAQAAR